MVGPRLWLIGGTQDSAELAVALGKAAIPCTVTVTTAAACPLYGHTKLRVRVLRLSLERAAGFLHREAIGAILDASHPFAAEISRVAIATARAHHIPYLRYERPAVPRSSPWTTAVPSLEALLAQKPEPNERILLILGSRWLAKFAPWQSITPLFARILPAPTALDAALAAGFRSDRLIALRPPVSFELELALWQQWRISRVIAKASGLTTGETIKQRVSQQLAVPLQVIERPNISYPAQTQSLETAIQWGIQQIQK